MERNADQPPLFRVNPTDYVFKLEYAFDIVALFNDANKRRLHALHEAGVPYVMYSGAHVAAMLPYGERQIGDMDVMIPPEYYGQVCGLEEMQQGRAFCIQPLPFPGEEHLEATFLVIGGMEIKADSDGTPGGGYFTLTDLVFSHSIPREQHDPETGETFYAKFAHPLETILFKAALWREKDQHDIYNLLGTGITFDHDEDQRYLWARIDETGVGDHVIVRLQQLGILQDESSDW